MATMAHDLLLPRGSRNRKVKISFVLAHDPNLGSISIHTLPMQMHLHMPMLCFYPHTSKVPTDSKCHTPTQAIPRDVISRPPTSHLKCSTSFSKFSRSQTSIQRSASRCHARSFYYTDGSIHLLSRVAHPDANLLFERRCNG